MHAKRGEKREKESPGRRRENASMTGTGRASSNTRREGGGGEVAGP